MNKNEIKKSLYKEKPIAKLIKNYEDSAIYETETSLGSIVFDVPYSDMSSTGEKFKNEVPAQLLIRWLVTSKQI